nr:MAG: hypothetical protein [Microviridae sp.]
MKHRSFHKKSFHRSSRHSYHHKSKGMRLSRYGSQRGGIRL